MKTILEIAREIGVSKQAVYKRYKGKLYTDILPYVRIENKTTYISEQGEAMLKTDFLNSSEPLGAHTNTHGVTPITNTKNTEHTADTVGVSSTDILLQMLQKELDIKNKQIEELTVTVRIQAESINVLNHNNFAETMIPRLDSEKKGSFLSRLFSWSKTNKIK